MTLTGTHHVRALKSALRKARDYWPTVSLRMEVRAQTLKLRYWGLRHITDGSSTVVDLDYQAIRSMAGQRVYELRIDDVIGGHRNIRVIFFDPPDDWVPNYDTPLKPLWILETFPKKRSEFTEFDIDRFETARAVVKERFFR